MKTKQSSKVSRPYRSGARQLVLGALFAASMLGASVVQAFPDLNLMTSTPDILSAGILVNYTGDNNGGSLTAIGTAVTLNPPGMGAGDITGGTFNISASIDFNQQIAFGTLNIGGTIAGLGFNDPLLTGTFASTAGDPSFGAGPGDPLEFLFDITGGDAANLYGGIGATAGVILSQSGYAGSFAGDFTNEIMGMGFGGGLADTFVPGQSVPAPGTLGLLLASGGLLGLTRRKKHVSVTH